MGEGRASTLAGFFPPCLTEAAAVLRKVLRARGFLGRVGENVTRTTGEENKQLQIWVAVPARITRVRACTETRRSVFSLKRMYSR